MTTCIHCHTARHATTYLLLYITLSVFIHVTASTPAPTALPLLFPSFSDIPLTPVSINPPKESQHHTTGVNKHLEYIIGDSIAGFCLLASVAACFILAYKRRRKRMRAVESVEVVVEGGASVGGGAGSTGASIDVDAAGADDNANVTASSPSTPASRSRPLDTGGAADSDVQSSHLDAMSILRHLGRGQGDSRTVTSVLLERSESGRGGSVISGRDVGTGNIALNPAAYVDGAATERGH